jgi:hypothetical protein
MDPSSDETTHAGSYVHVKEKGLERLVYELKLLDHYYTISIFFAKYLRSSSNALAFR